jgi:hypothetical protein
LIDISNKNEIIIDMVDFKSENQLHLFKFFSFGIFTSNEQRKKYMRFFKYPEKCQIIYHHWDKRFKDLKIQEKNEVKICYFGEKKKCELFGKIKDIEFHHIDGLTFKNSINLYLFYNCHYIIKPDIHEDLIQPMTKLSNAASLNCPVIVSKRPQYIELLGEDYPYYVEKNNLECIEQCINKIKSTFNKEEWNKALYQMEKVKIKTSFESIINDYRNKILK